MRKGISSLCGVVHERMGCSVRNGDVFIFIGSSRKLMISRFPNMMRSRAAIRWNGAILSLWWKESGNLPGSV